jgi:hypothetical protein
MPKGAQLSLSGVPQSLKTNASEAGNGRAGGKHVQLHNNNKSH